MPGFSHPDGPRFRYLCAEYQPAGSGSFWWQPTRVLIGRALTIKPWVLILHGPTVGVDIGAKDTIYQLIQTLAQQGMGVILISDDLPELCQNCDPILVMKKGRICQQVSAVDANENRLYQAQIADEGLTEDL